MEERFGCVPVSAVKERKIGFPGSTRGKQFFANKPLDASNKHALVLEVVDEAIEETPIGHRSCFCFSTSSSVEVPSVVGLDHSRATLFVPVERHGSPEVQAARCRRPPALQHRGRYEQRRTRKWTIEK